MAIVDRSEHGDGDDAAQCITRGTDRDRVAAELGHPTERGPAQHPAARAFGVGHDEGLTAARRQHDLVFGQPRLEEQHTLCGARSEQADGADEEPERLLRGAGTGCEQFLVELEECHEAHCAAGRRAVQDRLGTDQDVGVRHQLGRGIDRGDGGPREQCREVVANASHSGSDGAEPGAVAVETDRWPHGAAA